MKPIAIALKDLSQSFRSAFALVFMIGVPIFMAGLFYFLFGGLGGDEDGFEISTTKVVIANLDEGSPAFNMTMPAGMDEMVDQSGFDLRGVDSMGDLLTQILQSKAFSELVEVSTAADASSARSLVDAQQAGVALIIPPDFTAVLVEPQGQAAIELYQDPTLTIGPGIVQSLLSYFLEYAANARIGVDVTLQQLSQAGIPVDEMLAQSLAMQFVSASTASQGSQDSSSDNPYLEVHSLAASGESLVLNIVSTIMGGMMVFYMFYTGAVTAQSILREEEGGTLPRLFTTPTPMRSILFGKFLSVILTILVQVIVLMIFARLVFSIQWGAPLPVLLFIIGAIPTATAFGIMLVSFTKSSKQGGIIIGGLLTTTGMLGMINVFTMNAPNAAAFTKTLPLFVPQGWVMRSLTLAMEGSPATAILPYFVVCIVFSVIFFSIGNYRLQKRFA